MQPTKKMGAKVKISMSLKRVRLRKKERETNAVSFLEKNETKNNMHRMVLQLLLRSRHCQ